tara:strand:+ start:2919 stop:3491 length:573 start_codon:yes stop_codon:yes gene_type:complete
MSLITHYEADELFGYDGKKKFTTYQNHVDEKYMSKITFEERIGMRKSAKQNYRVLKSTDVSEMNRTDFKLWLDRTIAAKDASNNTMEKIKMVQDFVEEYGLARGCLIGCPKSVYVLANKTDDLLRKSGWPSHARLAFSMACLQSEETELVNVTSKHGFKSAQERPVGFENYEIVELLCLSVIDHVGGEEE